MNTPVGHFPQREGSLPGTEICTSMEQVLTTPRTAALPNWSPLSTFRSVLMQHVRQGQWQVQLDDGKHSLSGSDRADRKPGGASQRNG